MAGDTLRFDRWLLMAMRSAGDPGDPVGPLWMEEMFRDFTALGGVGVLSLLTMLSVVYLWLQGMRRPVHAAGDPGRLAVQYAAEGRLRPATTRHRHSRCAGLYRQFSQRSFHVVSGGVFDRCSTAGNGASNTQAAHLPDRVRGPDDPAGRDQPYLPGGTLAIRCACRLGRRFGLGRSLLVTRPLAERAQLNRHFDSAQRSFMIAYPAHTNGR